MKVLGWDDTNVAVAKELNIKDPTADEAEEILKNNEILPELEKD